MKIDETCPTTGFSCEYRVAMNDLIYFKMLATTFEENSEIESLSEEIMKQWIDGVGSERCTSTECGIALAGTTMLLKERAMTQAIVEYQEDRKKLD